MDGRYGDRRADPEEEEEEEEVGWRETCGVEKPMMVRKEMFTGSGEDEII